MVTGAAEKIISSPTQMFSVPEATVVTDRCMADSEATGLIST